MKKRLGAWIGVAALLVGCATHKPSATPPAAAEQHPPPTSSPGAKFALLPASVQRTITTQGGAAEIEDINKLPGAGRDVYEVRFRESGVNPTLYVAEDGTLVNSTATAPVGAPGGLGGTTAGGTVVSTLPAPVLDALRMEAPDAVVADVQARKRTLYEIIFKDPGTHPKLFITEDGTVLKEEQR